MSGFKIPEWLTSLIAGWPMIQANWPTFIVLTLLIIAGIWFTLSWSLEAVIKRQASEIKLLERQNVDLQKQIDHAKTNPNDLTKLVERAELSLHVYGDERLPERLNADNIWRWFYASDVLVLMNQDGTKNHAITSAKLFISFDRPVAVGTMYVRSEKPGLKYEVKEFTNRFAVIHFADADSETNIHVTVRP